MPKCRCDVKGHSTDTPSSDKGMFRENHMRLFFSSVVLREQWHLLDKKLTITQAFVVCDRKHTLNGYPSSISSSIRRFRSSCFGDAYDFFID